MMENKQKDSAPTKGIPTRFVFSKDNQVYLKKNSESAGVDLLKNEEWFPVNFHWKPARQVNSTLLDRL
ncbi:MAG: hypothetical protein AAFZ89_03955 [Bacteroidota bacterium]